MAGWLDERMRLAGQTSHNCAYDILFLICVRACYCVCVCARHSSGRRAWRQHRGQQRPTHVGRDAEKCRGNEEVRDCRHVIRPWTRPSAKYLWFEWFFGLSSGRETERTQSRGWGGICRRGHGPDRTDVPGIMSGFVGCRVVICVFHSLAIQVIIQSGAASINYVRACVIARCKTHMHACMTNCISMLCDDVLMYNNRFYHLACCSIRVVEVHEISMLM